jgi:hypothetical protein
MLEPTYVGCYKVLKEPLDIDILSPASRVPGVKLTAGALFAVSGSTGPSVKRF